MPFDLQPTLTGALLALRPLRPEDFAALYAVAADPLLWQQHPNPDRWQEPVFRAFFADALASGGALLATDAATGEVIGSSRFANYDEAAGEVEIGWTFLARSRWGGAYNGEMKRLMLGHAFWFVGSVVFCVGPENRRSRRAVEKLGAVPVETRRNALGQERVVHRLGKETFDGWPSGAAVPARHSAART